MLELLKQFEENTMDDAIMGPDNDDDDDDEGDGVDLAERLGGLDIGMLTSSHVPIDLE